LKKHQVVFNYAVYPSIEKLEKVDLDLMQIAIEARKNAYAPYSNFQVGAAVLLDNGEIVIGNNQENAAFPSGLCAERVAIYQASARFPNVVIKKVAITATSKNYVVEKAAAPCGNCRQSMMEYEQKQNQPIEVLLMGEIGEILKINSILDILPLAFDNSFLK
jgi:cytidine deaminase